MYPESDELNDYLLSDAIIDWQTPAVRQKALELTATSADETAKARCLYEWVRDTIPHSYDVDTDIVTCTASEVLQHGTGICFAKKDQLAFAMDPAADEFINEAIFAAPVESVVERLKMYHSLQELRLDLPESL
jgi:hypothetical protein